MSATVYNWKLLCTTESAYKTVWSETAPTTCPTNTAHTISGSSVTIIDQRGDNIVTIKEEDIPTQGHFQFTVIKLVTAPNTTSTTNIVFPININVITVDIQTEESHRGDNMSWYVLPNYTIGVLTSDASIGNTTLNVSPTVAQAIGLGYVLTITDGVHTDIMGLCTAVDKIANTVTGQYALTHDFSASSPTFVKMSIAYVNNMELGTPQKFSVGASKIGTSYLPKNVPLVANYTNVSSTDTKTLYVYIQFLY